MNPSTLYELAQIAEQEHLQAALRRSAVREARRHAGRRWTSPLRAFHRGAPGSARSPSQEV